VQAHFVAYCLRAGLGKNINAIASKRMKSQGKEETKGRCMSEFEILPPRNPGFLGREDLLRDIEHYFSHPPLEDRVIPKVRSLMGPSGIGKTQIALEYAHRHRENYRSIFWVQAGATSLVEAGFREILQRVGKPASFHHIPSLITGVHEWLKTNPGWLMIFDGAEPEVEKLLPRAGSGDIIITSLVAW
jgi:hypothetical protein